MINAGGGDDTIDGSYKHPNYSAVNGGAGNDSIFAPWNLTVTGGTGDDTIKADGSVIKYANGDGNDVVMYYSYLGNSSSNDTINVTSGTVNSITGNGNDVVLHIGDGNITLKSVQNRPVFYQEGNDSLKGAFFDGSKIQDMVVNNVPHSEVTGTDGADYIYNMRDCSYSTIKAGLGNDTIRLDSYSQVVDYNQGDGNDVIYGFDYNDTLNISSGTINSIYGNDDDVIVRVGTNRITLKDAIFDFNYYGNFINIKDSSSKNNIYVYDGNNIVNVINTHITYDEGNYHKTTGTSSDEFIFANTPALVIGDGSYSNFTLLGGASVDAGAGNDTIYATFMGTSINAGIGNDSIIVRESGYSGSLDMYDALGTIVGGAGKDTINLSYRDYLNYRNYRNKGYLVQYASGDDNELLL